MTTVLDDAGRPAPAPAGPVGGRLAGLRDRLARRAGTLRRAGRSAGVAGVAVLAVIAVTGGAVGAEPLAELAVGALGLAVVAGLVGLWARGEGEGPVGVGPGAGGSAGLVAGEAAPTESGAGGGPTGRRRGGPGRAGVVGFAVVGVVAAGAAQTWFVAGTVIAGGDNVPPAGLAWIAHLFSPWYWTGAGLGGPNTLATGLPWAAVLEVVHALGGSPALAQRLWLTALFTGAALAAHALLRLLDLRVGPAVLGALVVVFNAYVLSNVGINPVFLCSLVLVSAVPAVVVAVARDRLRVGTGVGLLVAAAPLVGFSYQNPPQLLMIAGAGVAGVAGGVLLAGRPGWLRCRRLLLAGLPLAALGCAYWALPALVAASSAATGQLASLASWGFTEGRATVANGLWLDTTWGWKYPQYYRYAPAYARFPLAVVKYLPPLAAFAAVPLAAGRPAAGPARRQAGVVLGAAALALGLVVVGTGTRWPGSLVFDPLYHLPLGWLLQEPGRFLMLAGVAYGILVASAAQAGTAWLAARAGQRHAATARPSPGHTRTPGRPAWSVGAVSLVVAVVVLAPAYPLATGQASAGRPVDHVGEAHVRVPAYWPAMAAWIDRHAPPGAVLALPPDDFYQMPYDWGYYGSDGFITQLVGRDVLDPSGQGYTASSGEVLDADDEVAADLLAKRWRPAADLLGALGTPDVLVRGDVDAAYPRRDIVSPAALAAALAADPLARPVHRAGPLALYAVVAPGPSRAVTVNSAQPDLAALGLLPAGSALVTSPLRPGLAGLLQTGPLDTWALHGDTLSTRLPTPPGRRYLVRLLAVPGSSAPAGRGPKLTVTRRPGGVTFRARLGQNLVHDGTLASGPWQPAVGNCDAVPGVPAAGRLAARWAPAGGPDGRASLELSAGVDQACEATPLRVRAGTLLVSLEVHRVAGRGGLCVWEVNLQACAALATPLPAGTGWQRYQTTVSLAPGTTAADVFVYATPSTPGTTAEVDYADVRILPLPAVVPVLVSPAVSARHPVLRVTAEAYSPAWHGPGHATHVLVDGLRNGWLAGVPAELAGPVADRWAGPERAALVASGLAGLGALGLLAGVGARARRAGRRRGR